MNIRPVGLHNEGAMMSLSDWGVIIALAFSGTALALELRRWIESKASLSLSVIADAKTFPVDDGQDKLNLTVVNKGSLPTTITHMVAFYSRSRLHRLFGKFYRTAVVPSPSQHYPIPYEVGINQSWHGMMNYHDESKIVREKGQLYVGVYANHTNRVMLIQVPKANIHVIDKTGE